MNSCDTEFELSRTKILRHSFVLRSQDPVPGCVSFQSGGNDAIVFVKEVIFTLSTNMQFE